MTGPNRQYAELLLEDYAGVVSEITAINQYLYHYFTLEGINEEVADLEECISLVEMHHMELLAETIKLLGMDPRYRVIRNNQEIYWNASFVYYGYNVCDNLAADIAAEWAAIAAYRDHQQRIGDPFIKELLERILQDEYHHIRLFNEAMQKYCK
ncbi:MAG: Manganese containing catalase [Pelotomaculum sp. PtaB.Bin104]|nr:MAG: Manganese containing catalase [Pelotomaculum sp. PtaB.Bin104]